MSRFFSSDRRRNGARFLAFFLAGALAVTLLLAGFYPGLGRALTGPRASLAGLSGTGKTSTASAVVQTSDAATLGPEAIADIVARDGPAVVLVKSTVVSQKVNPFANDPFFRQFFGNQFSAPQTEKQQVLGSGFIIRPDGYILTNDHVIDGAESVSVTLAGQDKSYSAKVVGTNYDLDLAVLKINAGNNLPTLTLGNSDEIRVGDWVIAIGNPYGLDNTVTVGVLSAKGRPVTAGSRNYSNLMQTDAAINPGNSGGPLLNLAGQVIGINTAMVEQAQGLGFAIPINTASGVLSNLINHSPTPFLGVTVENVPADVAAQAGLAAGQGALVDSVLSGSPAARAGLRQGDVIIAFNGKTVQGPDDLVAKVQATSPGAQATLRIYRDGGSTTADVTVGSE